MIRHLDCLLYLWHRKLLLIQYKFKTTMLRIKLDVEWNTISFEFLFKCCTKIIHTLKKSDFKMLYWKINSIDSASQKHRFVNTFAHNWQHWTRSKICVIADLRVFKRLISMDVHHFDWFCIFCYWNHFNGITTCMCVHTNSGWIYRLWVHNPFFDCTLIWEKLSSVQQLQRPMFNVFT